MKIWRIVSYCPRIPINPWQLQIGGETRKRLSSLIQKANGLPQVAAKRISQSKNEGLYMNLKYSSNRICLCFALIVLFLLSCVGKKYVIYEFSDEANKYWSKWSPLLEHMRLKLEGDSLILTYSSNYTGSRIFANYERIEKQDLLWTYTLRKLETYSTNSFNVDTVWIEFHRDSLILWMPGNPFCLETDRFCLYRGR